MTTEASSELLPCPFCGGPAEFEEVDGGGWSVGCEEKELSVHYCMGYQSLTSFATKREAAIAWNTRTRPASATSDVVERVARAIDPIAWRFIDAPKDHPAKETTRNRVMGQARAALAASDQSAIVEELRLALEECQDKLWVIHFGLKDEAEREAALAAVEMAKSALSKPARR